MEIWVEDNWEGGIGGRRVERWLKEGLKGGLAVYGLNFKD